MPYATTKEELEKHFENVEGIKSTRLLTDKATGKPKGFAFMEFENSKDLNVSCKAFFKIKTKRVYRKHWLSIIPFSKRDKLMSS